MEKYVIYYYESATNKKYIGTIYRNSVNDTKDIGDAIEFEDRETAINVKNYLSKREKEDYKVLCIKTTFDEVE